MAIYEIAGLSVDYSCQFDTLKNRSEKYLSKKTPDIKLSLPFDYFETKRSIFPQTSDEILEYMGMGTLFYKELLSFDGFMLHASAVEYKNECYLFSAPSGIGKSTHTKMWLDVFKGAEIVNDDKPAVRKIDGKYLAFGTPFSGKHDLSKNAGCQIKGVCFIDRGENQIKKITPQQAITPLFNQTIRPKEQDKMDCLCEIVNDFLENVPCYAMHCDVSEEAVKMAYEMMK